MTKRIKKPSQDILKELDAILLKRFKEFEKSSTPAKPSYVRELYKGGTERIGEKIQEEAAEYLEALIQNERQAIIHEFADLFFHSCVGLSYRGIAFAEVKTELKRRFGQSGIEEKRLRKKRA